MGNSSSASKHEAGAFNKLRSKHWEKFRAALPSCEGKVVAITGCTSGTGLTLALACAELKATVIMLNRKSIRAAAAIERVKVRAQEHGGPTPVYIECDLSSFASTAAAGDALARQCEESGLDVLCNNAGIMAFKDLATQDGVDIQMATNHLGHYILTGKAMPLLEAAAAKRGEARIVNHSSALRLLPEKGWDSRMQQRFLEKNGGNLGGNGTGLMKDGPWQRYQQTKMANVVFTYALNDRLRAAGSKVKALVAHPGVAPTQLHITQNKEGPNMTVPHFALRMMSNMMMHSQEDGTMGLAMCCLQPGVESGQFYGPRGRNYTEGKHNDKEYRGAAVLMPEEKLADEKSRTMLWDVSAKVTGSTIFISGGAPPAAAAAQAEEAKAVEPAAAAEEPAAAAEAEAKELRAAGPVA